MSFEYSKEVTFPKDLYTHPDLYAIKGKMSNQIEQNIVNSFRLAKSDIIKAQKEVLSMVQFQKELLEKVDNLEVRLERLSARVTSLGKKPKIKVIKLKSKSPKKRIATKTKIVTKRIQARAKKVYIAAKTGKKFHISHCPFARNIKPKSRVRFKSKNSALNKGFKPCKCV